MRDQIIRRKYIMTGLKEPFIKRTEILLKQKLIYKLLFLKFAPIPQYFTWPSYKNLEVIQLEDNNQWLTETHSSVLAWRIPGTGEPGRLPSMGSHRVGHNWSNLAAAAAATETNVCFLQISIKPEVHLKTNQGPSIFTSPKVSSISLKVLSDVIKDQGIRWKLSCI